MHVLATSLFVLLCGHPILTQNVHDRLCPDMQCNLPKCRCSHAHTPGDLNVKDTPQIVLFTFDDAVTKRDYDWYRRLFSMSRRNPNGCPISMTLFIQDIFTEYKLVNRLYLRGMEIAVHSVSHRTPIEFWKSPNETDLVKEVVNQKKNLNRKASVPLNRIKGWRSPFLQTSGDQLFNILKKERFDYDSSLVTGRRSMTDNLWPFTLDYGWPLHCEIKPCPQNRYAGLWEFPVAPLLDRGSRGRFLDYTYVDSNRPASAMAAYRFLKDNFNAYYRGSREPFMINMHTAWFYWPMYFHGMDFFIRDLLTKDDVYILNIQQALSWIKEPVPLKYVKTFHTWNCEKPIERKRAHLAPTLFVPTKPPTTTEDPHAKIRCDPGVNCRGSDCRCDGDMFHTSRIPKNQLPQLVLFTFDDAVNVLNENYYHRLFHQTRVNPNGCPITMTLFLQHMYTNYTVVKDLYNRGHEIAVHSVTHKYPNSWWENTIRDDLLPEVQGMRETIEKQTGIPRQHIVGWRSPFLTPSGDTLFEILQDYGFHYDSTLSVNRRSLDSNQIWPFTLDYGWKRDCAVRACPKKFYRGLWEFPVVALIDPVTNLPCTYVDSCRPSTKHAAMDYLMENFESYYSGSRAPFMLNMHAAWFAHAENLEAMDEFIQAILKKDDVYIVTVSQAKEWMRSPTSAANLKSFNPFDCTWRPNTRAPKKSTETSRSITSQTTKDKSKQTEINTRKHSMTAIFNTDNKKPTTKTGTVTSSGSGSGGLEWYVIVLIVVVVVILLIVAALLIVSIVKKNQAVQVSKLAQLAASLSNKEPGNEDTNANGESERVKTLETLKTISGSRGNVPDNIYHNIMEMRRTNSAVSSVDDLTHTTEMQNNQKTTRPKSRNMPLPRPPSGEPLKPTTKKEFKPQSKASTLDNPRTKKTAPNRYEGDLEAVRNSVMNDLNEFSQKHSGKSIVSIDHHYYTLDDSWIDLNLQNNSKK